MQIDVIVKLQAFAILCQLHLQLYAAAFLPLTTKQLAWIDAQNKRSIFTAYSKMIP